jgi:nitrite reductase/ring-hydroxylating ferredoxin subunit
MSLHKVATLNQVPAGTAILVRIQAREIGLFNVDGELLAIKNLCPHAGDALHKGKVENCAVICPGHAWRFDLRTGACVAGDTTFKVRTYPVTVQGDDVFIEV